jgi:hypothetical protein
MPQTYVRQWTVSNIALVAPAPVIYTVHTCRSISYQNWDFGRKQFSSFLEYGILGYNRWLLTHMEKLAASFLGTEDKQVLLKLY